MDLTMDCIPCFVKQALETSRMLNAGEAVQERVLRRTLSILSELAFQQTPPFIATLIHAAIRQELDVEDPYREVKQRSNLLALSLYDQLRAKISSSDDPFGTAVGLAIAGNIIDFGQGHGVDQSVLDEAITEALEQPLAPEVLASLRAAVARAGNILYLGDNAGEVVFDRLLIEQMPQGKITFVVRGGPIINDATMADAEAAQLHRLVEVVDNGSNVPGTILELCSPSFRDRFSKADLIIAKGQGNYETLSAVAAPIFFLLKVKCPVIARHLGSEPGDLVVRQF